MPEVKLRTAVATFGVALLLAGPAQARDLFTGSISIGGGPATQLGTNSARKLPEFFDQSTLTSIDPGYDATQGVAAALDLRGLAATVSFDPLSNEMRFQVPAAGIDVAFAAASRDEAQELFGDWLAGEYGTALAPGKATTRLLQALVAESPVDPVAGNPSSLQSRMFDADFRMATAGALASYSEGMSPVGFGIGLGGGYARADVFDVYAIDVPIRFGASLGDRFRLMVDVPLTATTTQGAWTGMGSAGVGLSLKPFDWWTLTPAGRIGAVGSVDLGGLALIASGTLTNDMRLSLGPLAVGMANMGGVASTLDGVEFSGYSLDYDLTNPVMRNGLYLEGSFGSDTIATGFGWRVYGSDVRFFGDELYLDAYQEVGTALAAGLPFGGMHLDVGYQIGKRYNGVSARLGVRF